MSVELAVFIEANRMPVRDAWVDQIRAAGFDVVIDGEFEMPGSSIRITRSPRRICPRTSSDGSAPARHTCAVFCAMADGILWDPQSGEIVSADGALAWASDVLALTRS